MTGTTNHSKCPVCGNHTVDNYGYCHYFDCIVGDFPTYEDEIEYPNAPTEENYQDEFDLDQD